jgi:arylsulfatase A-like enzyme
MLHGISGRRDRMNVHMTRRELFFLPCILSAAQRAKRPNIVFILTDDQRQDTIGALGNAHAKTPNVDRLVQAGVTFRNAYCMGGHIGAVCTPSRMMIQRGRSWFSALRQQEPSPNLASTFNEAGYVTYQFTKRGNIDTAAQRFYQHTDYPEPDDASERSSAQPGKQMADATIRFLKARDRSKPFFLYLAGPNPHDPRVASPEFLNLYKRDRVPLPPNFLPLHPIDNGELFVRDERLADWPRTEEEIRRHWHEYLAVISQMDHHIGRILDAVQETGEYQNTIFVFTSDQGLAMGSHGLMGKQNLYEHSMNAGLILAGPGIPRNRRVDAFAYLFDIYPTLCDLSGVTTPNKLEGRSLAPVLRDRNAAVRDTVLLGYRDVQRAVRRGNWKLIRYPKIDRNQLFDLANDPHERNDLSSAPEHQPRIAELLRIMAEQQKLYGDTAPLHVAAPARADVDLSFYRAAPPVPAPAKR